MEGGRRCQSSADGSPWSRSGAGTGSIACPGAGRGGGRRRADRRLPRHRLGAVRAAGEDDLAETARSSRRRGAAPSSSRPTCATAPPWRAWSPPPSTSSAVSTSSSPTPASAGSGDADAHRCAVGRHAGGQPHRRVQHVPRRRAAPRRPGPGPADRRPRRAPGAPGRRTSRTTRRRSGASSASSSPSPSRSRPRRDRQRRVPGHRRHADGAQRGPLRPVRADIDVRTKDAVRPRYEAMNPMRVAWLDPIEISHAVLFLASDQPLHLRRDDRGVRRRERPALTATVQRPTTPATDQRPTRSRPCTSAPTSSPTTRRSRSSRSPRSSKRPGCTRSSRASTRTSRSTPCTRPRAARCPTSTAASPTSSSRWRPPPRSRRRLRVGTGVVLVAEHQPLRLAKAVASLDVLSGGRVDFGVGYGWNAPEMANNGVDPTRRRAVFREHLASSARCGTATSSSTTAPTRRSRRRGRCRSRCRRGRRRRVRRS